MRMLKLRMVFDGSGGARMDRFNSDSLIIYDVRRTGNLYNSDKFVFFVTFSSKKDRGMINLQNSAIHNSFFGQYERRVHQTHLNSES